MNSEWCALCGVQHQAQARCPFPLDAESPERTVWRIGVETPDSVLGYGVLLADCGRHWRARIVTFPNVMWTVPGGRTSLKFLARSESEARRKAVDFIRHHCRSRGFTMRDELAPLNAPAPPRRRPASRTRPRAVSPSNGADASTRYGTPPRFMRDLPVRFGSDRPTFPARTWNLSAAGLFVATDDPMEDGDLVGLMLELEHCKVPLRGSVIWSRDTPQRETDRPAGMGLKLLNPPDIYVSYIRALAA